MKQVFKTPDVGTCEGKRQRQERGKGKVDLDTVPRTSFANPTKYKSWNGLWGCSQVGRAGCSYLRNHRVWLLGSLGQVTFCRDKSC